MGAGLFHSWLVGGDGGALLVASKPTGFLLLRRKYSDHDVWMSFPRFNDTLAAPRASVSLLMASEASVPGLVASERTQPCLLQ
jgi:hypothetical protein